MQQVTVLGATGSIGVNTLNVIEQHPDRYQVFALTAHSNASLLLQQSIQFKPQYAVLSSEPDDRNVIAEFKARAPKTELLIGEESLIGVAQDPEVDIVMAAIVGAAGLPSSLAAANAGKKVLLANKESLVVAGELFMQAVNRSGAVLLPIDSEHNAIFQCLPSDYAQKPFADTGIEKILLTGSGGPFRTLPIEQLSSVTPEQACKHPNWNMGRKISVDSATMMNKGLEVIEACHLFGVSSDKIQVVLHPQSIIHSMVSYNDGSVLAQLGQPDMRTPIAFGLAWPERIRSGVEPLDFFKVSQLEFSEPDYGRYPCLKLAFEAFDEGGCAPAILNAANEEAVASFLNNQISFTQIAEINRRVLEGADKQTCSTIEQLIHQDQLARKVVRECVERMVI